MSMLILTNDECNKLTSLVYVYVNTDECNKLTSLVYVYVNTDE